MGFMSDNPQNRDKSMMGWHNRSELRHISAGIGNDFTDGTRGMARAVKGAKKFIRSRTRQDNKIATRRAWLESND